MGELTYDDVGMLNRKVLVTAPIPNNLLKNIIIVQHNKIRHLINYLPIERFAWSIDHNIIIFPAQHSCTKREGGEKILHKDLFYI